VLVIFSGSETHKLEDIFGDLPVWLAAENGVFVRPSPQHLSADHHNGKRVRMCMFLRSLPSVFPVSMPGPSIGGAVQLVHPMVLSHIGQQDCVFGVCV